MSVIDPSKNILVSIIIPLRDINNCFVTETLPAINNQKYRHFELVVLPNKKNKKSRKLVRKYSFLKIIATPGIVGPAKKRDIGANYAQGEILAFLDDDAYPSTDWLSNLITRFSNPQVCGVGGPGITPPGVSWKEEASGWFSASPVGSGGYSYRFLPEKSRFVDDYPSMNLSVRKSSFDAVGGFNSDYYPGEDTKLCYDLVYILGKKIVYDPKVLIFHHRRPLWWLHLKQNGNFGLHRGYFVKKLPRTSARIIYFIPSLITLGLFYYMAYRYFTFLGIDVPLMVQATSNLIGYALFAYLVLLCLNGLWITTKSHNIFLGMMSIPITFITHIWYGLRFIQGLCFTKQL